MRRSTIVLVLATAVLACTRSAPPGDAAAPAAAPDTVPAGDARFVAAGQGSVRDTTTGLTWTTDDDGLNLPWPRGEQRCQDLRLDAQAGWRLPTIEELEALYDKGVSGPCGERACHLDPAITLTDPYVWSGTERGQGRRFYMDFRFGTKLAPLIRPNLLRRVLCVRAG